ncbi:MAG: glycosyltransferase family 39 protein, partial [Hyphomicrobium sp.]
MDNARSPMMRSAIMWFSEVAERRSRAAMVLIMLCLVTSLPGILRLPAVDRTEVVFAETTRDMLARGNWIDPRFADVVHQFRPIGTFWAQGVAASVAGEGQARDIRVYRLPGLAAVTLAVLALYWLCVPLIGAPPALLAAGLFAVAPLTVLLTQLAIADGLALLPATLAMLALLRIYVAGENEDTFKLAMLFWAALGLGMLVNALHTPILVAATLVALSFFSRDFWWLSRLHTPRGAPIALALCLPWLLVRAYQDGLPFSGLGFKKFLAALG